MILRSKKNLLRRMRKNVPTEPEYVTLLCRLDSGNNGFHSFYILPRVDRARQCRLREDDRWLNSGSRLLEFSDFYAAAKRTFFATRDANPQLP